MVGLKPDLEMVSFFSYDIMCAFLCALKLLFFAFIGALKRAFIYRSRAI